MVIKTNSIDCGDCKNVLAEFPEKSVDLIYVDPPFFSNRHYEVLWGDGYEKRAFEDRCVLCREPNKRVYFTCLA